MNTFDESTHTYRIGDKTVPSVTQVLDEVGWIDKSWFTPEGAARGTEVHRVLAALDRGEECSYDADIDGYVQAFLGTYRQVCSNGLVVGQKFFEAPRIRHTGDALDQIEGLVAGLVSKHDQLIEFIKELQSRDVSPQGLSEFLERAVALRLENSENVQNVQYSDLLTVRREADTNKDAYTIYNVVEENINRHGFRYQVKNTDENGIVNIRNMVARPLGYRRGQDVETSRSVDYKSELTDIAYEFLKAA